MPPGGVPGWAPCCCAGSPKLPGTLEEMFDVAAVLSAQPVPAGRRVAVLTNGGGPGILVADACEAAALLVPELSDDTQAALRAGLPPQASVKNPVDTVASATAEQYGQAPRLPGSGRLVGVARFIRNPREPDQAEVAITVIDSWQGRGYRPAVVLRAWPLRAAWPGRAQLVRAMAR